MKINKIKNINFPQTQYFGSKEKLGEFIIREVDNHIGLNNIETIFDAFSGSAYVGYVFKLFNKRVFANDYLNFNFHIARSLISNNKARITDNDIEILFEKVKKNRRLIEKNYAGLFYTKEECKTLDKFRHNIEKLEGYKRSLAFSIMIKVLINMMPFGKFNYTTAIKYRDTEYKSYIKDYDIKEKFKEYSKVWNNAVYDNGKENKSFCSPITEIVNQVKSDLIYIDPPYMNTDYTDYYRYYHFLETFVDYPENPTFIKKTNEVKREKSNFSIKDKEKILNQFELLFNKSKHIDYWVLSHNDEAFPTNDHFIKIAKEVDNRSTKIIGKDHKYKSGYERKNNSEYLLIMK